MRPFQRRWDKIDPSYLHSDYTSEVTKLTKDHFVSFVSPNPQRKYSEYRAHSEVGSAYEQAVQIIGSCSIDVLFGR
jgi:hypothetical protein